MVRNLPLIALMALLSATPAAAQYGVYAKPGSLGQERVRSATAIRAQQREARWQLGPIEVDPALSIGDLSYVSNIYSTSEDQAQSDLRASANAGLRAFMNLGPKVLVSSFAQLGYSWWQEQTELRSLDESFGVQLLGDFNRLQVELQAGRVENQRNLSSELEVPVGLRTDRAALGLEIDFWGPFSLFAEASESETRFSGAAAEQALPGLDLSPLDVDFRTISGGLAYRSPFGLRVGLGVERAEADFREDPAGRSSKGDAQILRLEMDGPRLSIDVDATRREIEFTGRPGGAVRTQLTGQGQIGWKLTEKTTVRLYRGLQLQPSAVEREQIYEAARTGVGLQRQPGPRSRASIFYENGEDEFARVGDNRSTRVDEITSYGLNWQFDLAARLTLELGVIDTRRESSDPAFDRKLIAVTSRVRLGIDLLPW